MKFTYKRRLFASPSNTQELIVPASTRAVKVNKFSTSSLQVYCADERGSIRLWDLCKVQERSRLASSQSHSSPKVQEALRLPAESDEETDDEQHEISTTRKRRDGTKEVTLLHECCGHEDAVLALDLCEAGTSLGALPTERGVPSKQDGHLQWILSVGADRVVKAWSLDLKRLGQLTTCQDGTRAWTPLGSKNMERRRSLLRAAGLNLTALRQRLAEKLPRKEDESRTDGVEEDENMAVAAAHFPEARPKRIGPPTASAQLAAFHLKSWPRRRNPLTGSEIRAAIKFEQV
ncbi:hypothetical protein, conserved [Eimeria praecox]|uniref:WD domain, G-beta repeat-containing protein n=1 Tax=Eimeria praecox TaxID=51316 RepID=U6G574_9EIME|nr:hypothetical protein, conserved [Eimeria praecox]